MRFHHSPRLRRTLNSRHPRGRDRFFLEYLENRCLLTVSLTGVPNWVEQGPGPITGGQTEGLPNNPVVGAVEAIAAHPTNPDIIFIASVGGGIWRTTNGTAASPTWVPLTDQYPSLSMGSIAFDPLDPSNNTIYAGNGLFSAGGSDGVSSQGLLRSTNGGATWSPVGQADLSGSNFRSLIPTRVTSATGQVILAGAFNNGLFRSNDTGATWTNLSDGAPNHLPVGGVTHLVSDPGNIQRFYAGVPGQGVYISNDAGLTWTQVNTGIVGIAASDRIELAVHNSPGNNAVYAALLDNGQPTGFFRSTNQGGNWVQMDLPQTNEGGVNIGLNPRPKPGAQGLTHFSLLADPTNPNVVYAGGDRQPIGAGPDGIGGTADDNWPNSIGANNFSGRLFRGDASQPAGSQWTPITNNGANGTSPHADSRDMVWDANGNILESDDGGIYRLINVNNPATRQWVPVNGNLRVTEFYSLSYDPVNNTIFGGTQDVGSPEQVVAAGQTWRSVSQADGGITAVEVVGSASVLHYSSTQRLGNFVRRSLDNTNTEIATTYINLDILGAAGKNLLSNLFDTTVQFIQPYVLNAVNPARMLIGTNFLYESLNRGHTLTSIGGLNNLNGDGTDNDGDGATDEGDEFTPAGAVGTVGAMAYGGRSGGIDNPDVAYVGAGASLLLRTAPGGPFNPVATYPGGTVRDIILDPDDWHTAYVIDTNQVFVTTDAGATATT